MTRRQPGPVGADQPAGRLPLPTSVCAKNEGSSEVRRGSSSAVAALFERYAPWLRRRARGRLPQWARSGGGGDQRSGAGRATAHLRPAHRHPVALVSGIRGRLAGRPRARCVRPRGRRRGAWRRCRLPASIAIEPCPARPPATRRGRRGPVRDTRAGAGPGHGRSGASRPGAAGRGQADRVLPVALCLRCRAGAPEGVPALAVLAFHALATVAHDRLRVVIVVAAGAGSRHQARCSSTWMTRPRVQTSVPLAVLVLPQEFWP